MQPGNPGQNPYGDQPSHGGQPPWEQSQYGQPQQPEQPGQYPPAPGYSQGAYSTPAGEPSNTMGLVSMILGIAAIPTLCCFGLGIPLGVAAIVLGLLGKNKADQGLASNRGQAQAGFICGIVAVALGVVGIVFNLATRS